MGWQPISRSRSANRVGLDPCLPAKQSACSYGLSMSLRYGYCSICAEHVDVTLLGQHQSSTHPGTEINLFLFKPSLEELRQLRDRADERKRPASGDQPAG